MQGSLPDRTSCSSSTFAGTDVVPALESVLSEDDGKKKFLSVAIDAALDIDKLMSPRVTAVHFCATGKSDPGDFICDRAHALLCTDLVASVCMGALYMAPHATFDAQLGARGKSGNDRYGCNEVSVKLASRIRLETLYAVNLSLALESHLLSQTPFVMVIPLLVCTTSLSVLDLDEFVLVKGNPDVSLILASDSALLTFLCSVSAEEAVAGGFVAGESIVRKLTACDSPPIEVFEQAFEAAVTRPGGHGFVRRAWGEFRLSSRWSLGQSASTARRCECNSSYIGDSGNIVEES